MAMAKREKGRVQWAVKFEDGEYATCKSKRYAQAVADGHPYVKVVCLHITEISPKPKAKRRAKR